MASCTNCLYRELQLNEEPCCVCTVEKEHKGAITMDDYISRAAAIRSAFKLCRNTDYPFIDDIQNAIEEIPAADVRPVVRGHYIGEYDGYADGNPVYDMWYCSECGCYFEDWDEKPTYNFCPNCGADMREVTANGN